MRNYYIYKAFSVALLCMLFTLAGSAQTGILTGTITDAEGEALIGATVIIEGTTLGTTTDIDGKYTIKQILPGTRKVQISYLGYLTATKDVEVKSGATNFLNVSLKEDLNKLEEVVVIGYGAQRKRDLVGNVAKVEAKEIKEVIGASFETALQGKATGLNITQSSGVAGAGSLVRIRGVGSFSSSGEPLYIIDGMIISADYFLTGANGAQNYNPLATINPNDIESVEVLKDAAATAIYGSRGANGVIIITTKRGKSKKPSFNITSKIGTSQPTRVVDILNASEWLQIQQEAWENDGGTGRVPLPLNLSYADIDGIDTRWYDYVLHTGLKHEHSFSVSQATKKFSYYSGFSFSDAESYQIGNSYERLGGRINVDYNPLSSVNIKLSTSLSRGINNKIDQAWAGGLGTAQTTALPIYPVYNEDGSYFNLYNNPVAQRELKQMKDRELRSISSLNVGIKPMNNLSIDLRGNMDRQWLGEYRLEDSLWTNTYQISKEEFKNVRNYSTYGTLSYQIPLKNNDHRLLALAGLEYQNITGDKRSFELQDVNDFIYRDYQSGAFFDTLKYEKDDLSRTRFFSNFYRINYSFKDKYFLQGVFRRDASGQFAENKRFANFPSIGMGYIISEENGFNKAVVNYLKLKASWGLSGNAGVPWDEQWARYEYPGVNSDVYNGLPVRYPNKPANPDLQWEVGRTVDGGVEIGLLDDRFTFDISAYDKLTKLAVIYVALQASSGVGSDGGSLRYASNVGKIRNRGIEASMVARLINRKYFHWKLNGNITHNANKVLEVGSATADALDGGFGDTRAIPGEPINTNYINRWSHVDPLTGRPVYLDAAGTETNVYSVVAGRVAAGNGSPKVYGGINNSLEWKRFTINCLFNYSIGGKIYDDAAKRQLGVVTDWNMRTEVFDRWRQSGDDATYPKLTMSMLNWGGNANFWQNNHSLWLYDASFLRLRNLSLSYNVPVQKIGFFKGLALTLSATNLLTFTQFTGWDPEVARDRNAPQERNIGGNNVTYLTAPQEKTYNFSISLDF